MHLGSCISMKFACSRASCSVAFFCNGTRCFLVELCKHVASCFHTSFTLITNQRCSDSVPPAGEPQKHTCRASRFISCGQLVWCVTIYFEQCSLFLLVLLGSSWIYVGSNEVCLVLQGSHVFGFSHWYHICLTQAAVNPTQFYRCQVGGKALRLHLSHDGSTVFIWRHTFFYMRTRWYYTGPLLCALDLTWPGVLQGSLKHHIGSEDLSKSSTKIKLVLQCSHRGVNTAEHTGGFHTEDTGPFYIAISFCGIFASVTSRLQNQRPRGGMGDEMTPPLCRLGR